MDVSKCIPQVRLKGFTDNWEVIELKNFAAKILEKNQNLEFKEVFTNSAQFGIISQRDFFDKDIANNSNIYGYYVVRENDFIYNPRISNSAPVGPVNRNKLNRVGIVSPLYFVFRPQGVNYNFLDAYFKSRVWHKYLLLNGDSGARSDRISIKDSKLMAMPFNIPDLQEQKAIGDFFKKIDILITLAEKKHEKTQQFKKAMLDKMFPKDNQLTPQIRLKDYKENWKQKRLGDLGTTFSGLNGKTKEDFGHGEAKYITYLNVFGNPVANPKMTGSIEIDSIQNSVKKHDIFFTVSSETPQEVGLSSVWMEDLSNVYLNSFCFGFRPTQKFDSLFIAYALRSTYVRKQIILLAQGISRYNISKKGVMDITVLLPGSEEQEAIGSFFKQLDNSLLLQSQKIEKLKNLKTALLEKMFV